LEATSSLNDTTDDIQNDLDVDEHDIIPVGFELTVEGFQVLMFQPECEQ